MQQKISLAIPTFQRFDVLFESFKKVYHDERISEIVIVDDASDLDIFEKIRERASVMPKIKLIRNTNNRDCYQNKYTAMSYITNDFGILLDSDNVIDSSYLDIIFTYLPWSEKTIYTPSFAEPNFDFKAFEYLAITKHNVSQSMNDPIFETMLNAANYFVNKEQYLKTYDPDIDPVTSDSIYMAYRWLERGGTIFVCPGLKYFHRVWPESHYQKNVNRTPPGFHESILKKLKEFR
jgi:glycosyltransferase involved in cell wall biosynthesis